jgi:hypothetical protein
MMMQDRQMAELENKAIAWVGALGRAEAENVKLEQARRSRLPVGDA